MSIEASSTGPVRALRGRAALRRGPSGLRSGRAELEIAQRYLRSARRDGSIRFLTRMTSTGIGLGVAALILAMAGLAGLQSRLLDDALSRSPELQVVLPAETPAAEVAAALERLVAVPGVESAERIVTGLGWIRVGESLEAVEVVGLGGGLPRWLPSASVAMDTLDGVVLPRRLVQRMGLQAGSVVELVSPRRRLGPLGPQPTTSYQEVLGAYDAGKDETRRLRAAVPVEVAERLFPDAEVILDVEVRGRDLGAGGMATLESSLPAGGRLETWRGLNRGLLFVLWLEKLLVFIAVALIILVASFALISAVSLIVSNKQAEIGILGTLGLSQRRVRRLFTWLGGLLALTGAGIGAVVAALLAWALDRFELIPMPGDVYIVDHLPFLVRPGEVAFVLFCTFVFTLGAARLAARRASALTPLEALRR